MAAAGAACACDSVDDCGDIKSWQMSRLSEKHRKNTQVWFIAKIFEKNPFKWLSGKKINSIYSLKYVRYTHGGDITLDEMIKKAEDGTLEIPGDVQRQLRTFYDDHCLNGLKYRKTGKGSEKEYYFDPTVPETIIKKPPRQFTDEIKKKVEGTTENKCEVCGNTEDDMNADHWRSYKHYHAEYSNISTQGNCVWLCQKCNIIKSDRSGIHLVRKRRCSYTVWFNIEQRITRNGFPANDKEQKEINKIRKKYKYPETYLKLKPPKIDEGGTE